MFRSTLSPPPLPRLIRELHVVRRCMACTDVPGPVIRHLCDVQQLYYYALSADRHAVEGGRQTLTITQDHRPMIKEVQECGFMSDADTDHIVRLRRAVTH